MKLSRYSALSFLILALPTFAARPVDLSHQKMNFLKNLSFNKETTGIKEVSQSTDFNQTTHIRIKETYVGYPVFNGNGIVHVPKSTGANLKSLMRTNNPSGTTMNGTFYEGITNDLKNTKPFIFEAAQANKALQHAIINFKQKTPANSISDKKSELMVYVDDANKAHWAFHVSFYAELSDRAFEPNYLLDAATFKIYQQWDNIKTLEDVKGGGIGGNPKMGKLIYDGAPGHLAALAIQRDGPSGTCYLQNDTVKMFDYKTKKSFSFPCYSLDRKHNNVYWNTSSDEINGGYSPNDDSFYAGNMLQAMYKELYGLDVLTQHGKPMVLKIFTHSKMENAYWRDVLNIMVIGDGESFFYPLASVGVIAHEVSHGFTSQHSNLVYYGPSGGINEAFSDMAAQVVEKYAFGKSSWQIGSEIVKMNNVALRYMDRPSKDCEFRMDDEEECSIDTASDYRAGLDVHFSSGVFNRAFYLLANTPDWDAYKAFGVMLKANSDYWTPSSGFLDAACGVVQAAEDHKYDSEAVKKVFYKVGIDTAKC